MKNYIITGVVAVLVGLAIGWAVHTQGPSIIGGAQSSSGVTNTTAKLYSITVSPLLAAASSSSVLNTDGTDRAVIDSFAWCSGVGSAINSVTGTGVATWQLQWATTTVANTGLQGNTNFAANLLIATSTAWAYTASSTDPAINNSSRIWPSNTLMTSAFNATNTAACTIGLHYISL